MSTYSKRFFGIISNLSGLSDGMIVNNLTQSNDVQTAQALDDKGHIIDMKAITPSVNYNLDGLFLSDTELKAGDVIHVADKDCIVSNLTKTESNQDFVRSSIQAQGAESGTVVWSLDDDESPQV